MSAASWHWQFKHLKLVGGADCTMTQRVVEHRTRVCCHVLAWPCQRTGWSVRIVRPTACAQTSCNNVKFCTSNEKADGRDEIEQMVCQLLDTFCLNAKRTWLIVQTVTKNRIEAWKTNSALCRYNGTDSLLSPSAEILIETYLHSGYVARHGAETGHRIQ